MSLWWQFLRWLSFSTLASAIFTTILAAYLVYVVLIDLGISNKRVLALTTFVFGCAYIYPKYLVITRGAWSIPIGGILEVLPIFGFCIIIYKIIELVTRACLKI